VGTSQKDLRHVGENLTNFKQNSPVIAAEDAFGNYFDSSVVWNPVFGTMFFGGLRLEIK
jgi:outer membrane receptor for ferrienterochelin and colicins